MTYLFLLPVSICMSLLAILFSPLLALFARTALGHINNAEVFDGIPVMAVEPRLPSWLSYFSTDDNSLLGDAGHKARWDGKSEYWQMVSWVCRNPAYNFEWKILAIAPRGKMRVSGNRDIKNRDNAVAGWLFVRCDNGWCLKSVKPLWGDLAFMGEFGWRLQPWAQERGSGLAQYVFSLRLTAFHKAEGS